MNDFGELMDTLDAAIFTGDAIHDTETLDLFISYLDRWKRESKRIRESLKEGYEKF